MQVRTIGAALAGVAALASGTAAAAPVKSTFTLVGQTYNVTLTEGFCLPDEHTKGVAETAAAADQQSQTDFSFFDCAAQAGGKGGPYGMIKTPKATLLSVLPTRPELLKQLGAAIKDGTMAEALKKVDVAGATNKAIKEQTGLDLKISGAPQFVDVDDKAAYLIGVMGAEMQNTGEPGVRKIALAAAMTEVKGRVFVWSDYAPYASDADAAALLRRVKVEIAQFIADNGG